MRLTSIHVSNLKGLRDVELPLSRFVCIIGENNAGKSTLLQALLKFVDGTTLDPSSYFDSAQDITIKVRIEEVSDADLALIPNAEHRSRFEETLQNRTVTLVRRYGLDGKSRLRWIDRVPNDPRFSAGEIEKLLKGKRPGNPFAQELASVFPEIAAKFDAKTNQGRADELIREYAKSIPDAAKRDEESDLPSGIDNSVRPLLPEPIFIPGVKDLSDDVKTSPSASFGKLLSILLTQITPQLSQAEEAFAFLKKSLNRITDEKGVVTDERLPAVVEIEAAVEKYVRQNFPRVKLDIHVPPPEIKAVLSTAEVWADDGINGPITTKGDGLKRAVTFAILRTYVEMKRRENLAVQTSPSPSYLFLFEEPELFLHPVAQRALFDALGEIAASNHVFVTTHSPLFFQPSATSTFIKLRKRSDPTISQKPFSEGFAIDISDLDTKAQFQLITFETTNTAFFCKSVVLVEGDSDYIVLPHLAKIINPEWNAERVGLAFCRISGKGSIGRYRTFFKAFDIGVAVIADLDCIIEGFEHLETSEECSAVRAKLIQQLDEYIAKNEVTGTLSSNDLRDIQNSTTRREQFGVIRETYQRCLEAKATHEELKAAGEAFFEDETNKKRRTVLQMTSLREITATKRELLRLLRDESVCLLENGAIESYYPTDRVTGSSKPARALNFCQLVDTKEKALALCDRVPVPNSEPTSEFELIFARVFATSGDPSTFGAP